MTKINSRQRRSNRWIPRGCSYPGCPCGAFVDRAWIAYDRKSRRLERRISRGKIAVKECVTVPCPPVQETNLEVYPYAW